MSKDVDAVRLEVSETLDQITKEKQPEFHRAQQLFEQGYRAFSGAYLFASPYDFVDPSLSFFNQYWKIRFPNGDEREWNLCLGVMPQCVWDELDPLGKLNTCKVFDFLKEIKDEDVGRL
jgi:hypothetical protein